MLSVALIWVYMGFTILPVGYGVLHFIYSKMNVKYKNGSSTISSLSAILSGIVITTLYAEIYSLFGGLNGKANLLLILINLVFVFKFKNELFFIIKKGVHYFYELSFLKKFILFVTVLLALYFTSSGYILYDTELYHAQAIHWLESYGISPGIANIQYRLGYNSSSMCFFALYSMKWLTGQSYHVANGFVLLFVVFAALKNLFRKLKREQLMSNLCSVGAILCCGILFFNAVSPTSDIMPMALVLWIVMKWTFLIENDEKEICPYALLCITGLLSFTGKVSMLMIVLLAIHPAIVLCREKRIKEIVIYVVMGIMVLIPFLIRNVIISGWLLYPFSGIDLFTVDWKIPKADLLQDAKYSMVGSRKVDVKAIYVKRWFPTWWKESKPMERYWLLALGISLLLWIKRIITLGINKFKRDYKWLHLEVAFFAGIIYWFFTAPIFRYSSSFVVLFPFIVLGVVYQKDSAYISKKNKYFEYVLTAFLVIFIILGSKPEYLKYTEGYRIHNLKLVNQVDYDMIETDSVNIGNMLIYYPKQGDLSGYYAFPASPYKGTAESVEMRGDTVRDGFRRKQ